MGSLARMGTTPKVLMQEPITQTEFHDARNTEERLFETIDV